MNCEYSIEINNEKYVLFNTDKDITTLEELKRAFRDGIKDPDLLKKIREEINNLENIPNLNINDINNNSVGTFTPTELIKEISTRSSDTKMWKNLELGDPEANIVVVGYGDENSPTKFKDGYIYLNLNYVESRSNNIIALTELALANIFKNEYDSINLLEKINNGENVDKWLDSIIKTKNKEIRENLKRKIYVAYYKNNIQVSNESRNINYERKSLEQLWNTFGEISLEERPFNYLPKAKLSLENLKQGDLVLIPNDLKGEATYANDWYEVFYDFYIDSENNYKIRTVGYNRSSGEYFLRHRTAGRVEWKDGVRKIVYGSRKVNAMIYNPSIHEGPSYEKDAKYTEVFTKFGRNTLKYENTLELLKRPGTVVTLLEGEKVKDAVKRQIKNIQGQVVTFADGTTELIRNIKRVAVSDLFIPTEIEVDEKYQHPSFGENILVQLETKKPTENLTKTEITEDAEESIEETTEEVPENKIVIGQVVGFDYNNGVVHFLYQSNKKTAKIPIYKKGTAKTINIKGVQKLNHDNENVISETDNAQVIEYIKNKFKESANLEESVKANLNKVGLNLNYLAYNIEQGNEYSTINSGDILYNIKTGTIHKVVDYTSDFTGKNYVKTIVKAYDGPKYLDVYQDTLPNYLIFKKTLNTTIADLGIRKNRIELFRDKQDKGEYVEMKVYQNPNGFVYMLPSAMDPKKSSIYEKDSKDITNDYKKVLKERYKWKDIPKKLYALKTDNYYKKDTMNTVYIPYDNDGFKFLAQSKELYKIVPGSYITFKGDADAYIVEKALNDKLVVSKYVHTKFETNDKNIPKDLAFVKSEKFTLDKDTSLEIAGIHVPKWAQIQFDLAKRYGKEMTKKSMPTDYDKTDSKEMIVQLSNYLAEKFGVKINIVHSSELHQFNDPKVYKAAAFVDKDNIYVNIDKASIAEPLHELLHLVLATMKANNPDDYYLLVNSVQNHPEFNIVSRLYNDINTEMLEETFVKLFSMTFRKNVLRSGIFNTEVFNDSIKKTISEMLDLEQSLEWEDTFDLMSQPIKQILIDFGSSLINNEESLIDRSSVYMMFDIAGQVRELLESGNLEQNCE